MAHEQQSECPHLHLSPERGAAGMQTGDYVCRDCKAVLTKTEADEAKKRNAEKATKKRSP